MSTTVRQEQQHAVDEITEVAPGILRLQLPINMPGLGHVNCYLLEDDRGFAVVDPGLPGDEAWAALMSGFKRASVPLRRIHTVVVTHSHPDHYGGAGPLRAETGADIVSHRAFRLMFALNPSDSDTSDTAGMAGMAGTAGMAGMAGMADIGADIDPEQLAEADPSGNPLSATTPRGHHGMKTPWGSTPFVPMSSGDREKNLWSGYRLDPHPTVRLDDADHIMLAGRRWVAIHTPGHTIDHLCLFDPECGVFLSGDHVLPTITPHIGGVAEGPDPLNDYFVSLRRVATLPQVATVLPAHGHPFTDLSNRVEAIIEHHHDRLVRLSDVSAELDRPGTVRDYMKFLFRERSWGSMAESETYAHLEHLRLLDQATAEWVNDELEYQVHHPLPMSVLTGD